MDGPREEREPRNIVDRAARSTIRGESTAFGFSIMITATFAAVQRKHGSPGAGDLMAFALLAVAAFTVLEGFASRGFREPLPTHGSIVATFGTALNFLSVGLAVLAALWSSDLIATDAAWFVCPVVAVTVYLAAETVEIIVAEAVQRARGDEDAKDVSD